MEIVVVAWLMTVVLKRGVEDIIHTARGGTPPRYAAASARRRSGAAGRYWAQLWDDVWNDKTAKRAARRAGSSPSSVARPRGAATQFFAGLLGDGKRAVGRSWDRGWSRLDEKRRERATRPRPGQRTVPGTVVPNAQDEDETERTVTPDGSARDCRNCIGRHWHDQYCLVVGDDPWIGEDEQDEPNPVPDSGPDSLIPPEWLQGPALTTTQEGTTIMTTTIPAGETTGVATGAAYCDQMATLFEESRSSLESAIASLKDMEIAADTEGDFAEADQSLIAAAAHMRSAEAKLQAVAE